MMAPPAVTSLDLARLHAAIADRYRVQRELRAGGMATVYLAPHLTAKEKDSVRQVI